MAMSVSGQAPKIENMTDHGKNVKLMAVLSGLSRLDGVPTVCFDFVLSARDSDITHPKTFWTMSKERKPSMKVHCV